MKKVYLAIPYSGRQEEAFHEANVMAGKLMEKGFVVFSPISHSHPIATDCDIDGSFGFWQKQDMPFIEWCDELHVVCSPNWQKSIGVNAEIELAKKLGKPIVYWQPVKYVAVESGHNWKLCCI